MTLVSTVVDRALNTYLLSGHRQELNKLAGTVTAGTTSLSFTRDLDAIQSGAEVEIDLESFYVWEVNGASKIATVEPAMFGSTAAAHTTGAIVSVKPLFRRRAILDAINAELAELSSPLHGLYRMVAASIDYSAATYSYDLAGAIGAQALYDARYEGLGSYGDWPRIDGLELQPSMSVSDFASTYALFVYGAVDPGRTMRVLYKAAFGSVTALADDIETVTGFPASGIDILAVGAAIRLMSGREIPRNFTEDQGDTRRPEEVQAGSILASYRGLLALRNQGIMAERLRLAEQYPRVRR